MIRNLRDFEAVHFLSNPKNVENIVDHDPRIKPDRLFLPFLNERDGLGRLIRHKNSLSKDLIRIESLPTEREKGERLETKNVGSHTYRDSISPRIYNQSEHPNLIQHTPSIQDSALLPVHSLHYPKPVKKTIKARLVKPLQNIVPPVGFYNHSKAYNWISPRAKIIVFQPEKKQTSHHRRNSVVATPIKREKNGSVSPPHEEKNKEKNVSPRRAQWQIEYHKLMNDDSIKIKLNPTDSVSNEVHKKHFFNKMKFKKVEFKDMKVINSQYLDMKSKIFNLKKDIFDGKLMN